eukprot:2011876-Alexandrium_andersonii.AAC.1
MSASLVGSEMCIRDRPPPLLPPRNGQTSGMIQGPSRGPSGILQGHLRDADQGGTRFGCFGLGHRQFRRSIRLNR